VPLEDALGTRAELQIDKADNACDAPRRPIFARLAHCRDAADELGLTQGLELLRTAGAIHLASLLVTRGADVMAGPEIGEQLRKQIAIIWAIPEVMMGVDDRQLRLDDLLVPLVEPALADRGLHCRHARARGPLREGAAHRQTRGDQPDAPRDKRTPRNRSVDRPARILRHNWGLGDG
jgi:hypothetical protein